MFTDRPRLEKPGVKFIGWILECNLLTPGMADAGRRGQKESVLESDLLRRSLSVPAFEVHVNRERESAVAGLNNMIRWLSNN